MRSPSLLYAVAFALLWAGVADSQIVTNVSICNWEQFRANIVRDTIYLDGGYMWWQRNYSDGSSQVKNDGNKEGLAYKLSLGQSFNKATNVTALFQGMSKAGGSAPNNIAPNYVDGVMFANDEEFILYGGLIDDTDSQDPPAANQILGYEAYQWGPNRQSWQPGFIQKSLPTNITRYVTNGAGVSAPSEDLGFYFSGMRGENWGAIQDDDSANKTASTLITVDMSKMREENWSNYTLPSNVLGRVNAELVWVPVSDSGVLIAIGGVTNTNILQTNNSLSDEEAAMVNIASPAFMKTLAVYDVSSHKWYLQNTTGDTPPQLASFCSVVAAAGDGSSFNIYIYGGYNGVSATATPSDDVYILSVPSFTWIKAYSGNAGHGRSGHKCIKVYPDQMFVLGGLYSGNPSVCLDGGILQVFNLNTLRFQDSYNPNIYNDYEVPSLVTAQIGGNAKGGATKTSPASWSDDALSKAFSTKYTKDIPTYYPYTPANSATPGGTITPVPKKNGNGLPNWVGPVLGVILGLVVIVAVIVAWLLYRRHQDRKKNAEKQSDVRRSVDSKGWIFNWMSKTQPGPANPTMSQVSAELGFQDDSMSQAQLSGVSPLTPAAPSSTGVISAAGMQEADGSAVHELDSALPPPVPGRFEMPTEFNVASNNTTQEFNEPRSLAGVLSSSTERIVGEGSDTASNDSRPSRPPYHRHQISDMSSPLSDVSEVSSEDINRPRHRSDVSFTSPLSASSAFPKLDEEKEL